MSKPIVTHGDIKEWMDNLKEQGYLFNYKVGTVEQEGDIMKINLTITPVKMPGKVVL